MVETPWQRPETVLRFRHGAPNRRVRKGFNVFLTFRFVSKSETQKR